MYVKGSEVCIRVKALPLNAIACGIRSGSSSLCHFVQDAARDPRQTSLHIPRGCMGTLGCAIRGTYNAGSGMSRLYISFATSG